MNKNLKIAIGLLALLSWFNANAPAQTEPAISLPRAKPLSAQQASALFGGPTLITMHLKDVEPKVFFEELWSQAKLAPFDRNSVAGRATPLVSIDSDRQPFWSVVREATQKARVSVSEMGSSSDNTKLTPSYGTRGLDGPAISSGPFLITVSEIERSQKRVIRLGVDQEAPPAEDKLQLRFNLFSDPKFPLIPYSTTVTIEQAVDDKGASLIGEQPSVHAIVSKAKFTHSPSLYLVPPANNGGKLARFKGFVSFFIATKTETWEIEDVTQAKGAARGELPDPLSNRNILLKPVAKYSVDEVAPVEKGYVLDLSYARSRTPIENRALSSATFDNLRFLDEKGIELRIQPSSGRGMFGMSDARNEVLQGYTQQIQIIRTGKNSATGPIKMLWEIPVEVQEVEVPFEFSDLPLP